MDAFEEKVRVSEISDLKLKEVDLELFFCALIFEIKMQMSVTGKDYGRSVSIDIQNYDTL